MDFTRAKSEIATDRQEFLTAREVGCRLRLPLSTVYHLAKTGALSAVHLGRSWRFSSAAVAALTGRNLVPARVMVVEDDGVTRALVAGVLEPRGHLVVEAPDAQVALAAARQHSFDWILINFELPHLKGQKLIEKLRGRYSLGQMVMMTAFADVVELDKLSGLGAVTLLRKPIEANQLIECIERRLDRETGFCRGAESGTGGGLEKETGSGWVKDGCGVSKEGVNQ